MNINNALVQWPFYKIVWSMTWMDAIYLAVQVRFLAYVLGAKLVVRGRKAG